MPTAAAASRRRPTRAPAFLCSPHLPAAGAPAARSPPAVPEPPPAWICTGTLSRVPVHFALRAVFVEGCFCDLENKVRPSPFDFLSIFDDCSCELISLEPLFRLDLRASNSLLEIVRGFFAIDEFSSPLLKLEMDFYACLPLCSFVHACEGRFPQAGTPEIAIATHARPCGIGCRNGMPWGRLIPRVGMLTTTGH
uniref:Uncharacterized protein n=1 Tax=Ananas comosus var. bracteatus TaxID=296719 RepID=A0A6V7QGU1_ANACO|nr:unnamed protein product [Ananas comosus var. bracteatus]